MLLFCSEVENMMLYFDFFDYIMFCLKNLGSLGIMLDLEFIAFLWYFYSGKNLMLLCHEALNVGVDCFVRIYFHS